MSVEVTNITKNHSLYKALVSYIWTAQQLDVVKNLHRKIERYTFIFTPGLGWYLLGVGIVLFVFITEKRPAYLAISFLAYGRPAYEFVREVLQRYGPKNRFFQSQAIPFLVNVIICTILTWVYETRTGYFVSVWNFFADKIVGRNYFRIIACGVIGGLANLEFSEKQRPFMNLQVPVATAVLVRLYEKLQLMM